MERGDALAREVAEHALVHKVEKPDSDRPFSLPNMQTWRIEARRTSKRTLKRESRIRMCK